MSGAAVLGVCAMRRSPRPFDVALAATFHDPPAALADLLVATLPQLGAIYRGVAVATSPPTAIRMKKILADAGMLVGTPPSNRRGPLYRLALRGALATGAAHVHYLDLDRALHWLRRAPRELRAVLRLAAAHSVLLLGRTAKAHRSHHLPLYATEVLANRLVCGQLGLARPVDVLVPSFVLARDAARSLLARSRALGAAIYGEWAAMVMTLAPEIAYLECRGLDWETPDRHRKAVRRLGLPAWRRRQETPAEWALRIAIASAFVTGFQRTLARRRGTTPVVRRLAPRIG